MDDLVNRVLSFKNSKINNDHFTLAVNGFYSSNLDTTKCFICKKELEGWEPDEDPYIEHKNHNGDCPLVNLHFLRGRMEITETEYAKCGFFKYKIAKKYFFCFYCGEWGIDINQMIQHKKTCDKKRVRKFNDKDMFVTKMMTGKMNDFLQQIGFYNICIPANLVTFDITHFKGGWYTVREMLHSDFLDKINKIEKIMDEDIKNCLEFVENS
ncbi:Baculoviral IAP repeat-containing protein 5.2 [Dictyocoela muelleri]|nr:Baculoviral IAP repeat-containing protein 5.2 [Dictyocoela muelleri]